MEPTSARVYMLAAALCIQFWIACSTPVNTPYISPENCSWEVMSGTRELSMNCNIETLQGGNNPTNFSLIVPRLLAQLTIQCNDRSHQSEMVNGSFKHLHHLQTLVVENCKLEMLPSEAFLGLPNLKNLTIRTTNTRLDDMSLLISPMNFRPLESIESIDLSENNIKELPPKLLCGLNFLRFLNLTTNIFSSVVDTGFSTESQCYLAIQELEMAHNALRVLPEGSFASFVRLRRLNLSRNQIARVESSAFVGLEQLDHLNMAHNRLVALPSTLFQSTPRLSKLYLRNNSLSALPPGLLTGLKEITLLDLSHNQLSSLEWLYSDLTSSLTDLDLSYNRLSRIDSTAFRAITNIRWLYLQNNLIEYIGDGTFASFSNLHTLILSSNRLKHINSNVFDGLINIVTLHLDNNRLETMNVDAFKNNSLIQELNLSGNRLKTVPDCVALLKKLYSIDLSENEITDIIDAPYQGLAHLHVLNLMGNRINAISRRTFDHIPTVRSLNLARNGIRRIEQDTFYDIAGLHFLRLDSNAIEDVNGLFSNLHDMIMLNISANKLRWFDYALIPVGLQWLDIHDNQIEALGNYFDLVQNIKLRTLDVSLNRLTDIDSRSLPDGIEVVYLNNNHIKRIQPFAFINKHNLTRVDLTGNMLSEVEISMLRINDVSNRKLPEFTIAGNPYVCDCQMQWLLDLQMSPTALSSGQLPRIVDLDSVECEAGFGERPIVRPLLSLQSSEFLCTYMNHCVPLCHCCEFDACDCEMICPPNCTCYHDRSWNTNIVDCSSRDLSAVPEQLPMDISEVHLDGNNISVLTALPFVRREKVERIFANQSNIAIINRRAFASLSRLLVLHLQDNQISTLQGHEFTGLSKLRELYLSNNQLKYVSNDIFAPLQNLEILHLDRNYLTNLPLWSLQQLEHLIDLRLAVNPWTCECSFTNQLANYIHERGDTINDIFEISCVYNETISLQLWKLNVTDCHGLSEMTSLTGQTRFMQFGNVLSLMLILCSALALLVIVSVTLFVYHRKTGMLNRCGVGMFYQPPIEEEKLFDLFVSYSRKDEDFVAEKIASELESGNSAYRLCLHHRDLPVTGQYLSEAIHEAVESSRKTIVVISENFLRSDWCVYEFKAAHLYALHNSPGKLIVIFVGQVCFKELDLDIRTWIQHSTFLQWEDNNFWDKLRHTLPKARPRNPLCSNAASVGMHL